MSKQPSLDKATLEKYPSLSKFSEPGYREWKGGREEALLDYVKRHPNISEIKGSPEKLLEVIDEFACQEDFLINIGSDKRNILTELLREDKPKIIVELGGYVGYSAIMFAHQLRRECGPETPIHVWSLEFDVDIAAIATELIKIAGLDQQVTVVTGPAAVSIRKLASTGRLDHIDLLFLDHDENLYVQDLQVCEELGLLPTGTCIVADNVIRPGAPLYRKYVRSHPGLESRGIKCLIVPGDLEDEIEISKML